MRPFACACCSGRHDSRHEQNIVNICAPNVRRTGRGGTRDAWYVYYLVNTLVRRTIDGNSAFVRAGGLLQSAARRHYAHNWLWPAHERARDACDRPAFLMRGGLGGVLLSRAFELKQLYAINVYAHICSESLNRTRRAA